MDWTIPTGKDSQMGATDEMADFGDAYMKELSTLKDQLHNYAKEFPFRKIF